MTEILYYPLIDCDAEGSEKVAMIPTPHEDKPVCGWRR